MRHRSSLRTFGLVTAALLALVPAAAPAASLTPPNLTQATSISAPDLMLVWPSASGGPLKGVQWSVLQAQMQTALGSTYLQVSNNLSDVASAATARSNLGLGTAAQANTGTAGHVVPFADGAVTVSGSWSFTAPVTTAASTTSAAGFTITPGVAPTSPANGNCWTTSVVFACRIGGVTQNMLFSGNNLSDLGNATTARSNLGLGTAAVANTGTAGGTIPLLNGTNTWSAVNSFGASDLVLSGITGTTQCLTVNSSGVVSGTGTACGSGSGSVGTTGTPASGNLTQFSGTSTITNGNLSEDCTTTNTLAVTCTKTNGTAFGTFATANAATPPSIGSTTPAAGAFTTLSASSTVSGTGFQTYLTTPPPIGSVTPSTGAFTTLAASSTVSGLGFSTYLASPPAIGGTTAAAGSFTTLAASSTVSGVGFTNYLASPPAIGGTAAAAGSFTTLSTTSGVTSNRASIGSTSTDGAVLQNTTAAAASAQQWSPRLHWSGRGWQTGTGGSQAVDVIAELVPVQGSTNPSGNLVFSGSINGGAYGALLTLPTGGGLNVASGTYQVGGVQIACASLSNATAACSTLIGTSGATLPLLSTANTWSTTQTFPAASLTLSELATQSTNTIVGNMSGSTASPTAMATSLFCGTDGNHFACGNDSRFGGPTQNSQSTGYTLVLTDAGGQVYHPTSDTTARTWAIPANSSVAFPVGTKVELVNDCSAGVITLNITTDVLVWFPTGSTGSRSIAACGMATLTKVGTTRWAITGTGVS